MGRSIQFQEYNEQLSKKLRLILAENANDFCYIGLPKVYYRYINQKNSHIRRFHFFINKYRDCIEHFCNHDKIYISAEFNMPYMSENQYSTEKCAQLYKKIKLLFKDKYVIIFAGENILEHIKYDVFELAAKKEYVSAPKMNAFSEYDNIMNKAIKYPKDSILCFILGPTATVLAYDLSKLGYTAYDIGHMAKDYNAFMNNIERSPNAVGDFFAPD